MPRKRKRPDLAAECPPPLTRAEVLSLFREAAKQPPHPSVEWCEALADVLSSQLLHANADHLRSRDNERALETASAMRRAVDVYLLPLDPHPPAGADAGAGDAGPAPAHLVRTVPATALRLTAAEYNALEEARGLTLEEARRLLAPILRPNGTSPGRRAPIWEECALICWHGAALALHQLGRRVGTDEQAVAVKFAVGATRRLGFLTVTPKGLTQRLKKHRVGWPTAKAAAAVPAVGGDAAAYREGLERVRPKLPPSIAELNRINAALWGHDDDG